MEKFLTEERLGIILTDIYHQSTIVHDKIVPNSEIRLRPDYQICENKIIIEFDGYLHYSNSRTILSDRIKDKVYADLGYKIIRIPYFIQLTKDICNLLFGCDCDYSEGYPHGFIDKRAMLPCDFCEMGIEKFELDLEEFSIVSEPIVHSLKMQYLRMEDWRAVVPNSLKHLID